MDVHPTKNVSIGIDPYPYLYIFILCIVHVVVRFIFIPGRAKHLNEWYVSLVRRTLWKGTWRRVGDDDCTYKHVGGDGNDILMMDLRRPWVARDRCQCRLTQNNAEHMQPMAIFKRPGRGVQSPNRNRIPVVTPVGFALPVTSLKILNPPEQTIMNWRCGWKLE